MNSFDRAWDLVKNPYHGTTSSAAEKIMEEGLKPMTVPPGCHGKSSFATSHLDSALDYAASRMSDKRGGPVVIKVPDGLPVIDTDGDFFEYDQDIPPELLEIIYAGRLQEEGEDPIDYRNAINQHMDEWLEEYLNDL